MNVMHLSAIVFSRIVSSEAFALQARTQMQLSPGSTIEASLPVSIETCPERCTTCKAGGGDGGWALVDGTCTGYCSSSGWCGNTEYYSNGGTDCSGCTALPWAYQYYPNVVTENDGSLGGWGGSCTCPNGVVYQVADNGDSCGSLACNGGTSGTCNKWDGPWTRRGVKCASAPTNTVWENDHSLGGWGGSCTCPNGEVYQVADNGDSCGSLACNGGTSGTCNRWDGAWSKRGVWCMPASPAPTPEPTPQPTAEPTSKPQFCKDFCANGGLDPASKKCKWASCGACPECVSTDTCKPWCKESQCSFQSCKGCSVC